MIFQTKKLGDICYINPTKSETRNFSDSTPVSFVPMSAVNEHSQSIVSEETRKFSTVKNGFTYFKKGDILFAKITPCMENGKVALSKNLRNEIGFGSTEFHVLRAKKEFVLPEYIYYLVRSEVFRKEAEQKMTGSAGQKRVPKEFIINYEIPLPPLKTQKEIVAKLDEKFEKLREAKKLREEALVDTEKILSQTLREIFEEGKQKGWEEKTIEDSCVLKSGTTISPSLEKQQGDLLYLKVADMNLSENQIEINTSSRFCDSKKANLKQVIPIGSVIFPKRGGAIFTNKKRLIIKPTIVDLNIMAMIPGNSLESKFLYYWFTMLDLKTINSGSSIPQINNVDINPLKILIPPLAEQKQIVKKLDVLSEKLRTLRDLQTSQLTDLKSLERAYLREAFRGELV